METAIEAAELKKTYPPGVTALDGVSLYVGTGTVVIQTALIVLVALALALTSRAESAACCW
jgi:hypothetical protein